MKILLRQVLCIASPAMLVILLAGGCTTRSISNSGHVDSYGPAHVGRAGATGYQGELSEFHVLGIQLDDAASEEHINKVLDTSTKVRLKKGSAVLLIQSGADMPDAPMNAALDSHFVVVPFSGKPDSTNVANYSRALRLAAAQAGCETVICYWGKLESARRQLETKTVSWVPVAGWMIPDERQHMRIRLKVALMDVRSGNWTVFSPEAFDHRAASGAFTRASSDQRQVEKLKQLAYQATAEDIVRTYAN